MPAATAQPTVNTEVAVHPIARPGRVISIDILRGLTIAFMILVNDPGDGRHVYTQLEHATWNGWTLTDLVFPNFLFLVGCSIVFSMQGRLSRGDSKRTMALRIARRALGIFAIDMAIVAIPYFHWTHFRLYGVLTRIAIVYLIAGLIFLCTQRIRVLLSITTFLLVLYWVLQRFVKVPGIGHPYVDFPFLDPNNNLGAWLDRGVMGFLQRTIHTGVLYEKTRDPEGLLSTIPAIGTCLLGICAALWMRRPDMTLTKNRLCLLGYGVLGIALGQLWNPWFPINKRVWTSSYVLFAAGIAASLLALVSLEVDRPKWPQRHPALKALSWPWLVFGTNAIAAYCMADIYAKLFDLFRIANPANPRRGMSPWSWLYLHTIARQGSTDLTSAIWAFAYVVICFVPIWILWRKKIFLKV